MRVAAGFDHRGSHLRDAVLGAIAAAGHEPLDLGVDTDAVRVDYPDIARNVGTAIREGRAERGVLVFENATLADAARELNRYNTQKLVIADASVAKLTFDATIPTNGIQTFTRVAQQVFGLRIERRDGEVIVSR